MNKRIYIVEDDEPIRDMVYRFLGRFNYESEAFSNCETALSRLETAASNERPDLIITDTDLRKMGGVMNGDKFCREIKSRFPGIKVIGASGDRFNRERKDVENSEVYREAGADAFFAKPYNLAELLSTTKKLLEE